MLDRLRRRQQTGIERRLTLEFLHDLLAFGDDAHDGITGLPTRRLVQLLEDLFKSGHVLLRLPVVLLESGAKLAGLRRLGYFRESGKDLLFREIDVLKRVVKQFLQVLL